MQGAFLALWNGIQPAREREYDRWHTFEHVPERLRVEGIVGGVRYWAPEREELRYFTLYETRTIDVLASAAYRARLDAPTPWTRKVQPTFTNFVRAACRTSASEGRGTGGALATIRVDFADTSSKELFAGASRRVAAAALGHHGITSIHVGIADASVTRALERLVVREPARGLRL